MACFIAITITAVLYPALFTSAPILAKIQKSPSLSSEAKDSVFIHLKCLKCQSFKHTSNTRVMRETGRTWIIIRLRTWLVPLKSWCVALPLRCFALLCVALCCFALLCFDFKLPWLIEEILRRKIYFNPLLFEWWLLACAYSSKLVDLVRFFVKFHSLSNICCELFSQKSIYKSSVVI